MTVIRCELVTNDVQLASREFTYSGKFRITTDDRSMSAFDVLNQATLVGPNPFPAYFATYLLYGISDPSAFMQAADCRQLSDNEASTWIANATWSPIKDNEETDDHTSRENPLNRPVVYYREWEEISVPIEKAWNETALTGIGRAVETLGPIQNAAGQEPSTPIMTTKRIPIYVAEKNYATQAEIDDLERTYGNTLNNGNYGQYSAGECLFRGVSSSKPRYEGGQRYFTGTIRIAAQRGGWTFAMVNRGFKVLEGGVLKEATVQDKNGKQVPVSEPVNLELDGSKTPDGQIGTIIDYRLQEKTDFSAIGV